MAPPTPDRFIPPPLSPSYAPTPTPPWHPAPPPPPPSSEEGRLFAVLVFAFAMSMLVVFLCRAPRANHDRAEAAAAPRPRALRRLGPTRHFEEQLRRQARAANPAARLPAFQYNRSVEHNVTVGGEEECSVCLGTFQLGEMVRLLPLCLHLYHVECIDPWLDAHSTCPTCRSDTRPTMDVLRLPPV